MILHKLNFKKIYTKTVKKLIKSILTSIKKCWKKFKNDTSVILSGKKLIRFYRAF